MADYRQGETANGAVLRKWRGKATIFYGRGKLCRASIEGRVYIIHAKKHEDLWSIWEFGPTKELNELSAKELGYIEKLSKKK